MPARLYMFHMERNCGVIIRGSWGTCFVLSMLDEAWKRVVTTSI